MKNIVGTAPDTALKQFKNTSALASYTILFLFRNTASRDNPYIKADRFRKGLSSCLHQPSQSTLDISTDTLQGTCQVQTLPCPGTWDEGARVCLRGTFMLISNPCSFYLLSVGRQKGNWIRNNRKEDLGFAALSWRTRSHRCTSFQWSLFPQV